MRWRRSLHLRLMLATVAALALALGLAGVMLSRLFDEQVTRQFAQGLTAQLDQLTAQLAVDPQGRPQIDAPRLSDPRWMQPYSGLYWQVDRVDRSEGRVVQRGVLRSRSLWDAVLALPDDALADGELHRHTLPGPDGARLLALERTVALDAAAPSSPWRLIVAADRAQTQAARQRFDGQLMLSLGALGVLLALAAWAQVAVGLAPLRALQRGLLALHEGRSARLDGAVPAEVQPLVDGFNRVLDRNDDLVVRARTQAGNLAHAIKTPLSALAQAAAVARRPGADAAALAALAALVGEQVAVAQRQVDWHLKRARAAGTQGRPGVRASVSEAAEGLLRAMQRVHAGRGLDLRADGIAPGLHFGGELQDLQEMLGNLVDNACKWARQTVRLGATAEGHWLRLVVDDDGPGIAPERREAALARGTRLDESVPGSGLGLAIVQELAGLYGGGLALEPAPGGGLRAVLRLPAA
ncbi:MAG: sensor histidine kinase [Ideonella sp. WA131b]|jgi:signal transduction histidine kinase|nr:sensor histidine kinase [Ideonella sp. WA131b]